MAYHSGLVGSRRKVRGQIVIDGRCPALVCIGSEGVCIPVDTERATTVEFLTAKQFGELMHLQHSQAYKLLTDGHAPSVRINGRRLVPVGAFTVWYAAHVTQALADVKPAPVRMRKMRTPDAR